MSRNAQILIVVLLIAVVAMGGLLISRQQGEKGGRVLVYAPCGLQGPLQMAVTVYRQQHPETPLEVVYDNANVLVRRVVKQGERPDVFISPGELEISQVARENLIDDRSVRDFGTLDMVLIAPAKNKMVTKIEDLASPAVKAVALGDPEFNSVGYYGEQILRARGVWEAVRPKLILREFPLEAFNLVERDQAAAGLAYLTCPLETAPEKASKQAVRIVEQIPRGSYGPIRLQLGVLKTSKQQAASRALVDFMLSEQAQQVMASNGVGPVEAVP